MLLLLPLTGVAQNSTCYGTTGAGSLDKGVKLPSSGSNYTGYSYLARIAGRTYVHSEVSKIVVAAYRALEKSAPGKIYKYAETGKRNGGMFKPHKTHQNGLSVDFMTPMIDRNGRSTHLPTHPFNRLGYNIELDSNNQYKGLRIDYSAMAAHVVALHQAARARGHDIWRVIFDPALQKPLFNAAHGQYLRQHIRFSTKRSWVRHDEHYHVDFAIPCKSR
jgi:penicillin-insensitive murein endopeptidase